MGWQIFALVFSACLAFVPWFIPNAKLKTKIIVTSIFAIIAIIAIASLVSHNAEPYPNESSAEDNVSVICDHPAWDNLGFCITCRTEFPMSIAEMLPTIFRIINDNVPVHNRPYTSDTVLRNFGIGVEIIVIGRGINSNNELWYRLSNDNWIYSGDIARYCDEHVWDIGFCISCRAEYPMSITAMSPTVFRVIRDDAPVRKRPYNPEEYILRRLSLGTEITVIGSGINSRDNLWYQLNDGNWIYSGNVE